MTSKIRIYLDTSVISAYLDERAPSRQELTQHFWSRLTDYEACISPVVIRELGDTPDPEKRGEMLKLAEPLTVISWTEEMDELVREYIRTEVFSPAVEDDAMHVASCVVEGIPILLSWNFAHLVNRRRRIAVNLVNLKQGYREIEILAPPELT